MNNKLQLTRRIAAIVWLFALFSTNSPAQLTSRLTLDKDSYGVGEPLIFTLDLKNIGSESIYTFPKVPGRCFEEFRFSMQAPGMACEIPWTFVCEEPSEIKPGDSFTESWPLDFWFRVTKPGTYKTNISLDTRYATAHGGVQPLHVSSDLQLNVVPANPADVERELAAWRAQLSDPDFNKRHDALDVLATTAPEYFHDEIFRLARDEDAFKVEHAVGGLERLNTPDARALLAEILTSPKLPHNEDGEASRCDAIQALGLSGDASYFNLLLPYVEHTDTCESEFAALAVARMGRGAAVPSLRGLLASPQAKDRMHAIDALRSATSPEAVEALIDALRDQDSDVREKADANLVQLTGHSVTKPNQPAPSALQLENLWRAWWHKHASDTKLTQPPEVLCRMS